MNAATSSEAPNAAAPASADAASAAPTVTTVASLVPLKNSEALAQSNVAQSAHGAGAATTESTEHPSAEDGGLPQLKTEHWGGQIVWLIAIFAIFYLLVAKVFTPRQRHVISTRGSTIAEDLANARANRDEAEAQAKQAAAETAEAHTQARKLAAEALARSNAEIAALQAAEDEKLNARLSEAEGRIRAARNEAMTHVTDIASETAQALVEKLTGKAATAAALKSALGKV